MKEWHIGRSFHGTRLEDDCPCIKGECGLAVSGSNEDCPQHGMSATKTLRQMHYLKDCPGKEE